MAERAFQRVRADSSQGEVAARPPAAVHRAASGVDRPPVAAQPSIGNAALARMLARARHAPAAVQRSAVHDVLASPGQPLAAPVREEMEARLGADFSDVRVHTDGAARASAAEVGARAYTSAGHIVIGEGGADQHTLAHELSHVIQQRQGKVAVTHNGAGLSVSDPSDHFEREAEANAIRAMTTPLARRTPEQIEPTRPHTTHWVQRANGTPANPGPVSTRGISTRIRDIAEGIITARANDVNLLYQKPGGWELWLQGEMYVACSNAGLVPLAETSVYGTAERADLGFQASDGDVYIELKCEGFHNATAFPPAVKTDAEKLKRLLPLPGGTRVAVQIAISKNKTKELGLTPKKIDDTGFWLHSSQAIR